MKGRISSHRGPALRVDLHRLFLAFPVKYTKQHMVERLISIPFSYGNRTKRMDSGLDCLASDLTLPFDGVLDRDS